MIKIYSEKEVKPDVYLSLSDESSAGVTLLAVDPNGERIKGLLTITNDGYLKLHLSAQTDGIQTDANGIIKCK